MPPPPMTASTNPAQKAASASSSQALMRTPRAAGGRGQHRPVGKKGSEHRTARAPTQHRSCACSRPWHQGNELAQAAPPMVDGGARRVLAFTRQLGGRFRKIAAVSLDKMHGAKLNKERETPNCCAAAPACRAIGRGGWCRGQCWAEESRLRESASPAGPCCLEPRQTLRVDALAGI